jgi:hypothetical protein
MASHDDESFSQRAFEKGVAITRRTRLSSWVPYDASADAGMMGAIMGWRKGTKPKLSSMAAC